MAMSYRIVLSRRTHDKLEGYLSTLRRGGLPGGILHRHLSTHDIQSMTTGRFLEILLNTKRPRIFAESEIRGDGSDWNPTELSILGDISIAMPVHIFDNGLHRHPGIHHPSFDGHLVFTPGALLRNDSNLPPADFDEVTRDHRLDADRFSVLYERRLAPVLRHINRQAEQSRRDAVVTIPGLGCGQFAGIFRGRLGSLLADSLRRILEKHAHQLPHIRLVYFDPYDECDNSDHQLGDIVFRVRPLTKGNPRPQLCHPTAYEEESDDFSSCDLHSVVAWDHVSWPGNDFYSGARATDDGVKAAATSAMTCMTGVAGEYDDAIHQYRPPPGYTCWRDVVIRNQLSIKVAAPQIFDF